MKTQVLRLLTLMLLLALSLSACAKTQAPVGISDQQSGGQDLPALPSAFTPTPSPTPESALLPDSLIDSLIDSVPAPIEAPTPEPSPTPAPTPELVQSLRGNTTGNIVNDGEAAFDGENLVVFQTLDARFANVYKGYLYYVNMKAGGKIYRQPLTGAQAECLSDATNVAYLNVTDDLIFYRSTDEKYAVRRMELNGGNDQIISVMRASRLAAVDGWLYYANWDEGTEGLWRMDYEGKQQTCLYGGDVPLFINVSDGLIYWVSNEKSSCLAVTDPNTGETFMAEKVKHVSALNVFGDTLYFYMEDGDASGLYAADTNMTQVDLLYRAKGLYNINVADDHLYFRGGGDTKSASDDILYRCDLYGNNVFEVAE